MQHTYNSDRRQFLCVPEILKNKAQEYPTAAPLRSLFGIVLDYKSIFKRLLMEGVDRISALPDEIILHILSFLTVDHVVPTSVLSKRWRYLWTLNPKMRFPHCSDLFGKKPKCSAAVIDRCIKQYKGNHLQDLLIRLDVMEDESKLIQEWFNFAIDRKVECLDIKTAIRFDFRDDVQRRWVKVPDSLFSQQSLQHLRLSCCELHPPLNIKCFDSLKHLSLKEVTVFDGALESLLSKCHRLQNLFLSISLESSNLCISLPHLQQLGINSWSTLHTVEIYAPNLLLFTLSGCITNKLYLQNAPHLRKAILYFEADQGISQTPHKDLNFWGSTMHNIKNLEVLNVSGNVFELMLMEYYSNGKSGFALNNLKEFDCHNFKRLIHPHYLVHFFRDCPSLVKLQLKLSGSGTKSFVSAKQLEADLHDYHRQLISGSGDYDTLLDHLTHVELIHLDGDPMHMALVNFFLTTAKVLEELHLEFVGFRRPYQELLVTSIFMWPKVSGHATIVAICGDRAPIIWPSENGLPPTTIKPKGEHTRPINYLRPNGRLLGNYARYFLCCVLSALRVIFFSFWTNKT